MFSRSFTLLPLLAGLLGCGMEEGNDQVTETRSALTETADKKPKIFSDETADSIGKSETVSPTAIDLSANNPFFYNFGTNGRTCGTCHQESLGWTITPQFAQSRPANDPLFLFDGSDCLPPGVSNPNPSTNSRQMLTNANVRIDIGIPAGADFSLASFVDPLGCPTAPSAANLRMYRRPLPSSNTHFLSTVMWDGRENSHAPNNTVALIEANLSTQSNDATRGHAQAAADLPTATRSAIVNFEINTFNAQVKIGNLQLKSAGATGGGEALLKMKDQFFIGINDVLGCAVPNSCQPGKSATFTNIIFTTYKAWETVAVTAQAAAIGRGEVIFNTKTFPIDNVGGINRDPGDPVGAGVVFNGFCGTCHDSPKYREPLDRPTDRYRRRGRGAGGRAERRLVAEVHLHGNGDWQAGHGHRSGTRPHHRQVQGHRQDEGAEPARACHQGSVLSQRSGAGPRDLGRFL